MYERVLLYSRYNKYEIEYACMYLILLNIMVWNLDIAHI